MFCPVCSDEYRTGFTRCASCDVGLVETLDAAGSDRPAAVPAEAAAEEPMANLCGFFTLEEAREARDKVRDAGRPAEILIRDVPGSAAKGSPREEFWLRVRPMDFRAVANIVGFEPAAAEHAEDEFTCSACGAIVRAADDACPGCGLGFEG